ncbi:MAG: hypothetical protein GY694_19335 [Gammaproteobacteria bacterium]|nr:hypothetical protein [Gammaproteobacteria bacterium]
MWTSAKTLLLSVLSMTLSCLLGGDNAIQRPKVEIRLHGSSKEDQFLYDSGAQVSLISKKTFRKIAKEKRPKKIDFNLTCSGVSGSKLKVLGCYMLKANVLNKSIEHPFFVVNKIPGQSGVVGIDIIKKFGLSLDVINNQPFYVNSVSEATLTKDTYLPARSRQACKIRMPENIMKNCKNDKKLQILQVDIPECRQVFCDEILCEATEDGYASVYLTNCSTLPQKLPKHMKIGEVEAVSASELRPFSVESTTPMPDKSEVEEFLKKQPIPVLDAKRRRQIISGAKLDHLPSDLKDKYIKILLKNHLCISLDEFDLGRTNMGAHSIPTKADCPPTYQKQFPLPYEHEKELKRQVLEWLRIGIIRPCESEYNSSLFLVAKKPPPQGSQGIYLPDQKLIELYRILEL